MTACSHPPLICCTGHHSYCGADGSHQTVESDFLPLQIGWALRRTPDGLLPSPRTLRVWCKLQQHIVYIMHTCVCAHIWCSVSRDSESEITYCFSERQRGKRVTSQTVLDHTMIYNNSGETELCYTHVVEWQKIEKLKSRVRSGFQQVYVNMCLWNIWYCVFEIEHASENWTSTLCTSRLFAPKSNGDKCVSFECEAAAVEEWTVRLISLRNTEWCHSSCEYLMGVRTIWIQCGKDGVWL